MACIVSLRVIAEGEENTKVKNTGEPAILITVDVGIFKKIKDCTVAESLYHSVSSLFGWCMENSPANRYIAKRMYHREEAEGSNQLAF